MEVLKIATAGSVDDGKSTLIGRLLYDTHSLTDDKLQAIEQSSRLRGFDYLDFSLATDGLVAEREQGITIDVAHIYFSTKTRSYIIADTPGHVEYTRNMVTGASTSQVSIILIDARNGVIEQTYRHFFINNLLRIKDVVVAINKMDLVDFSEDKFNEIKEEIEELAGRSTYRGQKITFIPICALHGDNVVSKSKKSPWYHGKTLLEHLEKIDVQDVYEQAPMRFPVQTVIRPKTAGYHDFRGYAGKLYGGEISVGDEIIVLPSQTTSKIKGIHFFDEKFSTAERGSSITVTLEDDLNVSRGDMIVKSSEVAKMGKDIEATICWMDKKPLQEAEKYILQHGVKDVLVRVEEIETVINTDFSGEQPFPGRLILNEIGNVRLKLSKPLFYDSYEEHKSTGAFILIDPQTKNTAGVGFIH
ncbi:MAG: 50S ribosome-binding GTPase [Saprospiraceae bacterium]|nr:50S ribosome-binding GTPase [Saprospiraceae bacterium]MCB9326310.1 50S ribosome-binding GTPase [Lewinellaceae bacterium]